MIEVFKIVRNMYDPTAAPNLITSNMSATRGNNYKLLNRTFNHNFRKFYFTARNMWNSLPDYVVESDSVDMFKSRLDSFRINQDVYYDWTVDLTGIGDHSEYVV